MATYLQTAQVPTRFNGALTANCERKLLEAIARRLPACVSPDGLTLLGFGGQLGAGLSLALTPHYPAALTLAAVCIGLNWLGDSLDGTVARVRQQQRPRFGYYIDHAVDMAGAVALMSGLACSGLAHGWTAAALLTGFLLLAGESFLAAETLGRFRLSQGWFGPTELRLLLMAGLLAAWRSPYVTLAGHRWLLFDVGGTIGAVGMAMLFSAAMAGHTAELNRQEPRP